MSRITSLRIKAKLLQKAKRKAGKSSQLKDAYEIIARSAGYNSWRQMKSVVETYSLFRPDRAGLPYWNNWYRSYQEALSHLQTDCQFLLPYEQQFFICGGDYIESLGIALDDPDLKQVGHDWVKPLNSQAWQRLIAKLRR